jgi:uncharacterized protein involved in exopolysaccharide biosynthesis
LVLSIISSTVVFFLPPTYKSEGLILIEAQEIPDDLVRSTVTSYADQRIQVIQKRIMTTTNIMDIVRKFGLYKKTRATAPSSEVVALFRDNMAVTMVEANVIDPRSGMAKKASIAFTISFLNENPKIARDVANELVTMFLAENIKSRNERAAETSTFLDEEASKFQAKVQDLEEQIADFKNQYSDSLPELLEYNLKTIERLEEELSANRNQITSLKDEISAYTSELSVVEPYLSSTAVTAGTSSVNGQSLENQLSQAQVQYNSLVAKYSHDHPDVLLIERQIKNLEQQLGITSSGVTASALQLAQSELNKLKERYSDNHPDVKQAIAKVEALQLEANKTDGTPSVSDRKIDSNKEINPLYSRLQTNIKLLDSEQKRLINRQLELNDKIADFEERVVKTHQVKRVYDQLIRDHENNLAKYTELKSKQLSAELAQSLETENKGESFTLIDPPQVGGKPVKPNRSKLTFLGIVVSFVIGLGLAIVIEFLFSGIRGFKNITDVVGQAPLVTIQIIKTKEDIRQQRNRSLRLLMLAIVVAILGVVAFHFFIMSLDVLWFKVMRKITLL